MKWKTKDDNEEKKTISCEVKIIYGRFCEISANYRNNLIEQWISKKLDALMNSSTLFQLFAVPLHFEIAF